MLARKYGRRQRLLQAASSARSHESFARKLLGELRALGVCADRVAELERGLRFTDVKRRGAAVWAILDALETAERGPRPTGRTA